MVGNTLMLFLPIPKACLWVGYTASPNPVYRVGYTLSQRLSPNYTPTTTPTQPNPPANQTTTNHTPIAQPHTPPLRVDSDEMRQNRKVFGLMRCWNARKRPRMGPKVHEVDSARSGKQGFELARSRFAASAGANEGG